MSRYDGLDGTDDTTAPRRGVSRYIGGRSANGKGGQVPNAEVHNSNGGGGDRTLYSGQSGQGGALEGGDRELYNGLFGSCTAAMLQNVSWLFRAQPPRFSIASAA